MKLAAYGSAGSAANSSPSRLKLFLRIVRFLWGKWLVALWLVTNCKNGVSSYEIARDLKVTQKSTWFMLHRIREAMQSGTFTKLSGEVEADETFIGGKAINMHKAKKERLNAEGRLMKGGQTGKAIVMGLLERETRKVRVNVMADRRKRAVRDEVRKHVEPGSMLYTDALKSYNSLPEYAREFIDHTEEYVRGAVHTNGLENFWSLLKRSLKGTYVSVEPFHLQAYCDEQAFRFNNRKTDDATRFSQVCSQIVNRRLTWNRLTGKDEQERQ